MSCRASELSSRPALTFSSDDVDWDILSTTRAWLLFSSVIIFYAV